MVTRDEHIQNILLNLGFIQRKLMQASPVRGDMDSVRKLWDAAQHELFGRADLEPATPAQRRVLMGVIKFWAAKRRGPTGKELAEALAVSGSAVTQTVGELVDKGYLVRDTDERDRRAIAIRLSPALRRMLEGFKNVFTAQSTPVFESLSAKELAEYHRLNKKIADALLAKGQESASGET